MSLVFNFEKIRLAGGNLCGADQFAIRACSACHGHYLYNNELKDIYYDASDLSRRFFKIGALNLPPCAYCGAVKWELESVEVNPVVAQTGPWAWVLEESYE